MLPETRVAAARNKGLAPQPESTNAIDGADVSVLRRRLLSWYRTHRRELPWRNAATPYHVWVSEVMLQQTRVEVVKDYFRRWVKLFPTVEALAAAEEAQVLHAWQGLGYYSRAKRLRKGAQFVRDHFGGALPDDPEELMTVPGIGPYSAGAIASIAFARRAPLVDGNVIRVLTRLFALPGDPNKAPLKKRLWDIAEQLVSPTHPGDFNQALMELGATVCTPKGPACYACPLAPICRSHQEGTSLRFPELPKKAPPTPLSMVMVIARHRGAIAIQTLDDEAPWWSGLDACPFSKLEASDTPRAVARRLAQSLGVEKSLVQLDPHQHTVTRYKITLIPVLVALSSKKTPPGIRWVPRAHLGKLALPAPHRKVLEGLEQQ